MAWGSPTKNAWGSPTGSSGSTPTPTPTPTVTFPNDTLLIDRMRVALVTEKPQILAPGWSY